MDLNAILQAMGPLKERMADAQRQRAEERFEGSAGGGAVRVVLRGDLAVDDVTIAPAAATGIEGDASMLEDLIAAAIGDAVRRIHERYGKTPDEQVARLLDGVDVNDLLGGLGGAFGP